MSLSITTIEMVGMLELGKKVTLYEPGGTSLNSNAPSAVIPVAKASGADVVASRRNILRLVMSLSVGLSNNDLG